MNWVFFAQVLQVPSRLCDITHDCSMRSPGLIARGLANLKQIEKKFSSG